MNTLTLEQQACNYETFRHIETVRNLLQKVVIELLDRAEKHDQSKLESPEVELFTQFTPLLASTTYGSPEYEEFRKKMKPALDHHYAKNKHHPEHYVNGIRDMTLIDLIEMFVDWKAATLRHHDGNLRKSIEKNAERFHFGIELKQILENTVELFDE